MKKLALTRRHFVASATAAAVLPGMAPGLSPGKAWAAGEPIKIGVGSDPVFSAFFVAAHEKLFAAEGANVALQQYADGGEGMNALVAQQVDLAAAAEPTNMVRFSRAELRPLAVVYQSATYIKMVLRKGLKDLAAIKRFGMVPGSLSEYCTRLAIAELNLKADAIELVRSGPPELPALLTRGDIDAFFVWEPWPTLAIDQGATLAMTNGDVGFFSTIWLTAAAAYLERDRAGAQAILRALSKASAIVQQDPQRTAAAVKAVTRIPEATTLKALKDMTAVVRDFTDRDYASCDSIAQFLAERKVTPAIVPYRNYLQRGFFQG